jgi:hypothetical protein
MCFFKKKQKKLLEKYSTKKSELEQNSTYKMGQFVHFRFRDELYFGYVNWIYKNASGQTVYDIQVGGQCPAIIRGITEETMFIMEERKRN